ncbi:RNA-directed DNA polymerase from mobile element jockey [Trichonephila inaurata madagascariensis]|uniref:RNA-directed DNA polymerase from mobile element jockey n=1 Tax=Trichonephila inaurata madagascariensis TaxID=2747483 RepID=A0A8X6XG57_9ARAC|nr:RNA-directed DNA polymerase from mobile element jockey [Trichonephila inaurata madagascariensis]
MFLIRDIHFQRLPDIGNDTSDLEFLGITVLSKDRTITIKNLYHPPNSQHLDTNMMEGLFDDSTIILGDFNAKNTTWGSTITNARGMELSNLVNDRAFFSWRDLDNIGSDHLPILVETDLKVNCTGVKNLHWNFKKADWSLFEHISNNLISKEETNAIISDNGHISVDAREAAEALAQHYANESRLAFSSSVKHLARVTRNQIKSCRDRPADNQLFNVDFTLPELSYPLQNLDTNKSPGPDSIPGHFLSHLGILGRERLLYICNLSWKTTKTVEIGHRYSHS